MRLSPHRHEPGFENRGEATVPGSQSPSRPPRMMVWDGKAVHTSTKSSNRAAPSLTPGEGEVDLHLGFDLYWFTIEQVGLVLPLLDGFDRSRSQHGVPADQLQVLNAAILADLSLQDDRTLNARLTCQRRIIGADLADQKSGRYAGGNAHALRRGDLGHGDWRRAQNAANHATHRSSRDTARNAAHHARGSHGRWRSLVFLDHLNFFRNLGGGAQFAVDDVGLNLLDYVDRRCGRRWWRRRRRWGHQH